MASERLSQPATHWPLLHRANTKPKQGQLRRSVCCLSCQGSFVGVANKSKRFYFPSSAYQGREQATANQKVLREKGKKKTLGSRRMGSHTSFTSCQAPASCSPRPSGSKGPEEKSLQFTTYTRHRSLARKTCTRTAPIGTVMGKQGAQAASFLDQE